MIVLPTLQRRIRGEFLRIVVIFGVLGLLLVGAIFVSGRVPTLLVSMNYDSIAWGREMETAMNALRFPQQYPRRGRSNGAGSSSRRWARRERMSRRRVSPGCWTRCRRPGHAFRPVSNRAVMWTMPSRTCAWPWRNWSRSTSRACSTACGVRRSSVTPPSWARPACSFSGTLLAVFMADGISGKVSHPLRARPRF